MKPAVLFTVLGVLLVLAAAGLVILAPRTADVETLPEFGSVDHWSFTNAEGNVMSSEAVSGKTWVASFMFTSCEGICPVMNQQISELHAELKSREDLAFVSFSVDPETDTPEVLREYAGKWDADSRQWNFLTGPVEDVHELAVKSFKVGSTNDPIDHSSRLMIVDEKGVIRGYYDSMDPSEMQRLRKDLDPLLD